MCRYGASRWQPAEQPAPVAVADADRPVDDADREAASADLRAHFTSGRLDVDEFSSRLEEVWSAATTADLGRALRDLPPDPRGVRPWAPPDPRLWRPAPDHAVARRIARAHVRTYAWVMVLLVAIWAVTGMGYFWPVWPLLFWGFFVFRHARWADRRDYA